MSITKSSQSSYNTALKSVLKRIDKKEDDLLKSNEIIKLIEDIDVKYITKRNYLNSIIVHLKNKDVPDEKIEPYIDLRDEYNERYWNFHNEGKMTEKQKENLINIEEVDKLIDELKKKAEDNGGLQTYQDYVFLKLYRNYPMRNDFGMMKVIKNKNKINDSDNFLLVTPKTTKFILNNYKTKGKYKQKHILIKEQEIKNLLRTWLTKNKTNYLFINSREQPISKNMITKKLSSLFKKHLNKNISSNMLRHIYMSSKYGDIKKELEEDAHKLGHSVSTGRIIYTKSKDE